MGGIWGGVSPSHEGRGLVGIGRIEEWGQEATTKPLVAQRTSGVCVFVLVLLLIVFVVGYVMCVLSAFVLT